MIRTMNASYYILAAGLLSAFNIVAQPSDDRGVIGGLRVLKPEVRLLPAPLQPLQMVRPDQSVLLGRSLFQAPGAGKGNIQGAPYEPIEDGGFRITGSRRQLNRPIVMQGQNRLWTGDLPIFRMETVTSSG